MDRNSAVRVLAMLCWCAACGKSGSSSPGSSSKDAGASVRAKPSGVAHEPLEFSCDSETAGSAATHAVFSEVHGELLLVASDDSVLRIPIKVTRSDGSKTTFDLRWNASGSDESGMPLVQTGTVDKLDGDRYSFEFSDLKNFVCKGSAGTSAQFWKTLPSLGLPATKYIEGKTGISMTFAPDLQQTVLEQGGEAMVFYYRVFSFTPDLIRLAVLTEAPNDGKTILGRSVTMTKIGDDYLYKVQSDNNGPKVRLSPVK